MIRCIIFILFACMVTACNFSGNKPGEKDFYNSIAGWDIKHVPIVPPFRASSTYPGQWAITGAKGSLHLGKSRGGDIALKTFGVSENSVYGETENGQWFLFNMKTLLYSEYATDTELFETLKISKLDKNKIETCDNYFRQLTENKRCYWYPKNGEKYPEFEEHKPTDIYTIEVNGKEKVTGFEVKGKIKKSVSKIYYFKVKYSNEKNDLYYISFDYSLPQLIKNDTVFTAYAEDNTLLTIAVYTPFPVAQSKGINEKDRVVISKQIDL